MTFRNSGRFPVVMAALHLALCLAAATWQSEGSWRWFPVFLVDFPVSIAFLPLGQFFPPLVVFGVLGTVYWFVLAAGVVYIFRFMRGRLTNR